MNDGSAEQFDLAIVGGGIVGMATADRLVERSPGLRVAVLEKEPALGRHQTGHNSGVLHSGVYYAPGSLKARTCVRGKRLMEELCSREGVPFERCGKVIVAVDASEVPRLERLAERSQANGVECEVIDAARLKELEPHVRGVRALHVPGTGIVDYGRVVEVLARRVTERGVNVVTGAAVDEISPDGDGVRVVYRGGSLRARTVVNCAGLHSDRVARLSGADPTVSIVPFRGEYWELTQEARELCRSLIYPVPDPRYPFLGVHFTRMIGGGVECGPNAVMAFAREGYRWRDVEWSQLREWVVSPGLRRLAARHWRTGVAETWRSLSRAAFARALQRIVPEVEARHLVRAPAGVRAQAVATDGALVDDFVIQRSGPVVNVLNAPSPAATASLAIAELIVDEVVCCARSANSASSWHACPT